MMGAPSFLLLAIQVSVLTYYLGVLIYALPIPVKGVKKWAPILIQDSIWAMILALSATALLYAARIVASWSGFTLRYVALYARLRIGYALIYEFAYRSLVMAAALFSGALTKMVSFVFIPLTIGLYGVITSLATVTALATILIGAKAALAALGVALMALPFRLGRNAGASLLAFSIVGSAMLPYLPHWISFIYNSMMTGYASSMIVSPRTFSYKFYNIWGTVYGASYTSPSGGLVEFINRTNTLILLYKIYPDGSYYVVNGLAIPQGTYTVRIEYMGLRLRPNDSVVSIPGSAKLNYVLEEAPYQLNFYIPNAVFARPDILLLFKFCRNITVTDNSNSYTVISCTPSNSYVGFYLARKTSCNIVLRSMSGDLYPVASRRIAWRGIPVNLTYYIVKSPQSPLYITLYKYGNCHVDWSHLVYRNVAISKSEVYGTMMEGLVYLIVYVITLPMAIFAYLTIMAMIMIAFAKAIGATYARILFVF